MSESKKLLERAATAQRESKYVEFKRDFDLSSAETWCETIKDILALSNSGGGIIIFGVENDGSNTNSDKLEAIFECDIADITNRIARYTNYQFAGVEIVEVMRGKSRSPAFLISPSDIPVVFVKPGTYDVGGGKQKTAFSQGTVYFRHGGKSEPGNRDDFVDWRDREIARVKKSWLGGVRKIVNAPPSHVVTVTAPVASEDSPTISARITDDPTAVKVVPGNTEEIWPHRRQDLIDSVKKRLGKTVPINVHDILCINKVFDVFKTHPTFAHKPHRLASPQYGEPYADWIAEQYKKNENFFQETREAYKKMISKK